MVIAMISENEKVVLIIEVMQGYPEAGSGNTLKCLKWKYDVCQYTFIDEETGEKHKVFLRGLLKGFDILMELAIRGKYKNCNFPNGMMDAGNWDGLDTDALVQCAIFGDVIYG